MTKTPTHHRDEWSRDDVAVLKQLIRENTPTRVIALKLKRTEAAIYAKVQDLGLSLKPTNQRPRTPSR